MVKETTLVAIMRAEKQKIQSLQRKLIAQEKEMVKKDRRIDELEAQNRRIIALLETLPTELMM